MVGASGCRELAPRQVKLFSVMGRAGAAGNPEGGRACGAGLGAVPRPEACDGGVEHPESDRASSLALIAGKLILVLAKGFPAFSVIKSL